ncbi:MAG: hypothetical protein WD907_04505 [Bacilli bacterium]
MLTYDIVNSKLNTLEPHSWENDMVVEEIVKEIEDCIQQFNLTISLKTTLSTMKGSIHWHLKQERQKGVLEVTYWPKKQQIWLEIHDNRRSEWNVDVIAPLAHAIAQAFDGNAEVRED